MLPAQIVKALDAEYMLPLSVGLDVLTERTTAVNLLGCPDPYRSEKARVYAL